MPDVQDDARPVDRADRGPDPAVHLGPDRRRRHEERDQAASSSLQFGPAVLAEPSKHGFNLLAWVLPFVGLGLGAVVLGALAWRWSRGRGAGAGGGGRAPLDPELERRVDEELARFDG